MHHTNQLRSPSNNIIDAAESDKARETRYYYVIVFSYDWFHNNRYYVDLLESVT